MRPLDAGDDDYTTLACVFALDRAHAGYHPNTGEANAIAQAHDLLAEIDIEITPKDLRGIWHSEGFADFRQKFHQFGARRFDDRSVEENLAWLAELWECSRRACGVAVEFS